MRSVRRDFEHRFASYALSEVRRQGVRARQGRVAPQEVRLHRFVQLLQRMSLGGFITLGIESSCDDTSVALLRGQREILAWKISSQIKRHAAFGGVVPEYASRMHLEAILPLTRAVFDEAGIDDPAKQIDLIAVTRGPGLMGSLLVGAMTAKAFAQGWGVPIIGVNHLEGHIYANVVDHDDLSFPFLCMVVSGGHTEIVLVRGSGRYELLGSTRDDAAGEAFDKVAKVLGLSYPGGPVIDKLASQGDAGAFAFPDALHNLDGLDFSFSGLKTAAMNRVNSLRQKGEVPVADFCASFQRAVVRTLLSRLEQAVAATGVESVAISGGVAANSEFRAAVAKRFGKNAYLPSKMFCTDNAVMIAAAGFAAHANGLASGIDLSPDPALDFCEE